jgi:putative membrane protein
VRGALTTALTAWGINVGALALASLLIDGVDFNRSLKTLLLAGLVFGLVNLLVKPIVKLFALPLVVLTLGVILFFVNVLMLYVTSWLVSDFTIDSFRAGILATIVVWAANLLLNAGVGAAAARQPRSA